MKIKGDKAGVFVVAVAAGACSGDSGGGGDGRSGGFGNGDGGLVVVVVVTMTVVLMVVVVIGMFVIDGDGGDQSSVKKVETRRKSCSEEPHGKQRQKGLCLHCLRPWESLAVLVSI